MNGPAVTVHLGIIERNARTIVQRCREAGIEVFGVTKGTCGMPQVARAMLRGGVAGIAESRFENIRRLRQSGIDCPIMLLRSPPLSRVEEVVSSVDISLHSELAVLRELSRVAERMGRVHDVIMMVDLGDLREGIWPSELAQTVEQVLTLKGVRIAGLGTNLTCFGAIVPTRDNLGQLVAYAYMLERRFGLTLAWVSGGNSSSLPLLLAGGMPRGINNLRIGEAILQGGHDTFLDAPWEALERDAFLLTGELLEVKVKPSMPIGTSGVDAFGQRPRFTDQGDRLRGIANIGREDVVAEGLEPTRPGVTVLGASSDHLVMDLTEAQPAPAVGDRLSFRLSYGALLAAMTSEYVEKTPMHDSHDPPPQRRVTIFARPETVAGHRLEERLRAIGLSIEGPQPPEAGAIADCLTQGSRVLLAGADHAVSWTALRAACSAYDAIGLVWFGARAAMKPCPAGDPGPQSVLYGALGCGGTASLAPALSPENVVIVGLREADADEAALIKASRITVFTMVEIDALGIREVMRQALRIAQAGTRGFHVSYHAAVTDVPGTPLGSGGITVRETHQAMESIAAQGGMTSMAVTGLGADLDPRAAAECANFVLSAFGKRIL